MVSYSLSKWVIAFVWLGSLSRVGAFRPLSGVIQLSALRPWERRAGQPFLWISVVYGYGSLEVLLGLGLRGDLPWLVPMTL
jgi:hypothetical protein